MKKTVIFIFGASGAGTTTLGRCISEKTGLFFMDMDNYFWENTDSPFTVKREAPERVNLMRKDIENSDGAVISGALSGWGDPLIPYFTLAVRVTTPTDVRLDRIKKREKARFGDRIEPGGDMYDTHINFLDWAASYDNGGLNIRSKVKHDEWQKLLKCPLICVDGTLSPEENYSEIKKYFEK